MFILSYQSCVDQSLYMLRQVVSDLVSPNRWLISMLVINNQSQNGDRGLQAIWRSINEQQ